MAVYFAVSKIKIRAVQDADFKAWLPLCEGYNTFYKRTLPDEITNQTWKRFLKLYDKVADKSGFIVYRKLI